MQSRSAEKTSSAISLGSEAAAGWEIGGEWGRGDNQHRHTGVSIFQVLSSFFYC